MIKADLRVRVGRELLEHHARQLGLFEVQPVRKPRLIREDAQIEARGESCVPIEERDRAHFEAASERFIGDTESIPDLDSGWMKGRGLGGGVALMALLEHRDRHAALRQRKGRGRADRPGAGDQDAIGGTLHGGSLLFSEFLPHDTRCWRASQPVRPAR